MKDDQDVYVDWMSKYGGFAKAMTLRDYFAATAMQGMLAENGGGTAHNIDLAKSAYWIADAMLEARK